MLIKSFAVAAALLALTFSAAFSDGLSPQPGVTPVAAVPVAMPAAAGIVAQVAMKAPPGRAEG